MTEIIRILGVFVRLAGRLRSGTIMDAQVTTGRVPACDILSMGLWTTKSPMPPIALAMVVEETYRNNRELLGLYVSKVPVWKDPYLQFSTNVSFCTLPF